MPKTSLEAPKISVGAVLKRMLKEEGKDQPEVAKLCGIGVKKLWRILNDHEGLDEKLAGEIAKQCEFSKEKRNQLLESARRSRFVTAHTSSEFGQYLRQVRLRHDKSIAGLARLSGLNRPDVSDMEAGRSVPSPLKGAALAKSLGLSPSESAKFFRLFGSALSRRLDISKTSTSSELVALLEWQLVSQPASLDKKTGAVTTLALPVFEIPRVEEAARKLQDELSKLSLIIKEKFRPGELQDMVNIPYSVTKHADGRVSVNLQVMVTY